MQYSFKIQWTHYDDDDADDDDELHTLIAVAIIFSACDKCGLKLCSMSLWF